MPLVTADYVAIVVLVISAVVLAAFLFSYVGVKVRLEQIKDCDKKVAAFNELLGKVVEPVEETTE
jgi:uncharacterized membrane protein